MSALFWDDHSLLEVQNLREIFLNLFWEQIKQKWRKVLTYLGLYLDPRPLQKYWRHARQRVMSLSIQQLVHVEASLKTELNVLVEVHRFKDLVGFVAKHFETA